MIGVIGQIKKFNGRLQMKAEEISRNPENVVMSELIPAAPDTPETMRAMVEETIDSMQSGELKKLVREMLRMAGDRLDYYPAAMVIHHAERSGLLHHITDMLRMAERMVECYPFLNRDLLLAGVIVHDLGKIDEMVSDGMGRVQDHTRDGVLIGHLVRGVANLEVAGRNTQVTGEWLTLLQHMLISHHGVPEYGSPQLPKIPEAEALFLLDTLDSKMAIYQGILQELPEGAISERKAALENRRIYHPLYRDGAE